MNDFNLDEHSIISWLFKQQIKTETGDPLDLRDHHFLFDIYRDFSPKQCIFKAAQIGFSTLAILKTMWLAKMRGMDIIYTLPTANDVIDFAGGKVNRIIAQNPVLQNWVKDKDSVEQKKVGNNVIYWRGTWTEKQALMISSDLNVHDEEDRSKQAIISQYSSRLQHSEYQWEWHFSNPSVEGNGVSRYWSLSDQKHWFVKCSNGHEWFMEWPACLNFEKKIFVCSKCGVELTKEDRRKGKWVKKWQNKDWSGYWIPLLIAPWVSAEKIIEYHETKSPEYFYNFVLGLPYVGEGNKINPDDILKNCTAEANSQENVIIGVDVGLTKHFVMGNSEGLFYSGKTTEWDDIERLLSKFPRSIAVIDALPDLTKPRELKEKYPGRVWLCTFSRDRKTMQFVRWGQKQEFGNVLADRNRMIQLVVDEFIKGRIPLQGKREEWQEYYSHWGTMYRINEWEEAKQQGRKNYMFTSPYRWESSTGNDHYVMATTYWRVGMDRFGTGQAKIFMENILDNLPAGQQTLSGQTILDPKKLFKLGEQEDDWRL
ncbi:MAG: phage terminase large subunit family protein [Nanoarchaeota archaeon]